MCQKCNVTHLDNSVLYEVFEKIIGEAGASADFIIGTGNPGGAFGYALTDENLLNGHKKSLEELNVGNVDILFIHVVDDNADLEAWLPAVDQLCRNGLYRRFGPRSCTAEQVREVYDHCKQKRHVLSSVYKGNYSAIAYCQESTLFPTPRKLNIAFGLFL